MARQHLDPRLLEKLLRGAISPAEARNLARHLMELCPDCGRNGELHDSSSGEPEECFDRVRERLEETVPLVLRQRDEAPGLLSELERHPLERQRILVRNNPRFQTLPLADLLLERAWSRGLEEPRLGEAMAELATEIVDRAESTPIPLEVLNDLRGRAWAYRGNFLRIASDFRAAEDAFRRAEAHLFRGTGDPLEEAKLLGLRSSLCLGQSRFQEAGELLRKALEIYLDTDDEHQAGRTLVKLGLVANDEGRHEEAMEGFQQGLERIDAEQEPRLVYVAYHNLVKCLMELGRFEEAATQLPTLRRMTAECATRSDLLRTRWIEGNILLGLDHESRAEAAFLEVRKGFVEQGIAYDAAAVSLELASLYLRQGRTAEIRELVAEMLPIFRSRDVHREAVAALHLLQRAVEMETLTLATLEEVAEVIRRSEGKSQSRPEEPS